MPAGPRRATASAASPAMASSSAGVEQLADRLEVGAQQHLRPDAAVDGHRRRVDLDERVLADELADPVAHEARPRPVPVVAGPVVLDRRRLAEALVVQLEHAHPALEAPSLALHRHEAAADAPRRQEEQHRPPLAGQRVGRDEGGQRAADDDDGGVRHASTTKIE